MERTKKILEMARRGNNEGLLNGLNDMSKQIVDEFSPVQYSLEQDAGYVEVEPVKLMVNASEWDNVNENIIIEEMPECSTTGELFTPTAQLSEISINTLTDDDVNNNKDALTDKEWIPPDNNAFENNSNKDSESVTSNEESEINKGKRRRRSEPKEWKRNKIANLRQTGKEYRSLIRIKGVKGGEVLRSGRKLGPRCTSKYCINSNKRFCSFFNEDVRKQLFNHFWQVLSWNDRRSYVASLVDCVKPKQKRREESGDRRGATFHYHLKINNERKEVCRDMFCNTLSIGVWSVKNWATSAFHGMRSKKSKSENKPVKSIRTSNKSNSFNNQDENLTTVAHSKRHNSPRNISKRKNAETFINSLPKLESHYCRGDSSKLYLEPIFQSTMELYRLYLEYCREHNKESVSRFTFTDILERKNISLFIPRKDQCDICCQHSTGNLSDEEYNAHIQAKDKARTEKEKDKEKAISEKCIVFTVDVQAVKLCPCLKAASLYYKTKLCCHNYTIFNLANREVDCYWWHEGEGELKASSFTSCLIHHLEKAVDCWSLDVSEKVIIIWSDGCGYQNKNKTLANALAQFSIKTGFTIEQKFLQKGHSQMEVDSVHASIEKRLKNRNIYLPEDYITATKEARLKNPYRTHYLNYSFFKDYTISDAEIYSSIRPGNKVNDPTINLIHHLKYTPDGLIQYKLDFDDQLQILPRRSSAKKEFIYPALYTSSIKIKKSKWDHLQQLKSVIPQYAHEFYDKLLYL